MRANQSERLQVDEQHEGTRRYHRGAFAHHLAGFAVTVLLNELGLRAKPK